MSLVTSILRCSLARGGVSRNDEMPAPPDSLVSDRRGEDASAGELAPHESCDDGSDRPRKRRRATETGDTQGGSIEQDEAVEGPTWRAAQATKD